MYWLHHGTAERVRVLNPTRDELYRAVELAKVDPVAGSLLCHIEVLRSGEQIYVPVREMEPSPDGPYKTTG